MIKPRVVEPRLPPVERDGLLIEDDPKVLDAHARALWHQWQTGDTPGYSRRAIKAAAIWLIDRYVDANAPPAYEAARLIRAIIESSPGGKSLASISTISPVRKTSEPAYWAALKFDAKHPPDPSDSQPSTATLYAIAKHVREGRFLLNKSTSQATAETTIKAWRKVPHYRANVELYRDMRSWAVRAAQRATATGKP